MKDDRSLDGIWYVSEKAKDFLAETMGELKAVGWEVTGDVQMLQRNGNTLLIETVVQKRMKLDG